MLKKNFNEIVMDEEIKDIQQEAPTYREQLSRVYAEENPETDYSDDEALYQQALNNHNAHKASDKERDEREQKIVGMFNADPRSAEFFEEWRKGGDPVVMLMRVYGDDFKDALEDPEKQDALAQANKEFLDNMSEDKAFEEECKANLQESYAVIDAWQEETDKTDEEVDQIMSKLVEIASDFIKGRVTREAIDFASKATNYDSDMEEAGYEGEVRGRNEKIDAKLRKRSEGDGTAQFQAGDSAPKESGTANFGILGSGRRSIWDSGDKEIRRKH